MKIGDKVGVHPKTFGKGGMPGRVVWIHPQERFALVEFEIEPQGPKWAKKPGKIRLRECFLMVRKRPGEKGEKC